MQSTFAIIVSGIQDPQLHGPPQAGPCCGHVGFGAVLSKHYLTDTHSALAVTMGRVLLAVLASWSVLAGQCLYFLEEFPWQVLVLFCFVLFCFLKLSLLGACIFFKKISVVDVCVFFKHFQGKYLFCCCLFVFFKLSLLSDCIFFSKSFLW